MERDHQLVDSMMLQGFERRLSTSSSSDDGEKLWKQEPQSPTYRRDFFIGGDNFLELTHSSRIASFLVYFFPCKLSTPEVATVPRSTCLLAYPRICWVTEWRSFDEQGQVQGGAGRLTLRLWSQLISNRGRALERLGDQTIIKRNHILSVLIEGQFSTLFSNKYS
ncbi:hypothetical protein Syun_021356 [Stephania yunnanensis]|uniref:Uncharacterized protein n=1 Tax=Stephania yunnanensis TaxID=152371 RepID=A0AAP0IFH4_9MAGN